jgi:hypothetical protein
MFAAEHAARLFDNRRRSQVAAISLRRIGNAAIKRKRWRMR